MTSKYDRSIEDIDRARMEESRLWSQRFPEQGLSPYGFGAIAGSYGYNEPISGIQPRPLTATAVPAFGLQGPISQNYPYGSVSVPFQTQPFGFAQGSPLQIAPIQPTAQHPLNPAFAPIGHNVYWFSQPQPAMNPAMIPFAPFSAHAWTNPYPTSRAFGRPPRGYKRSDELIRDEICKRLTLTPEIDATDVEVIVRDGEVTLRGTVDDRLTKRLLEDITETTFGVKDVLNEVRIGMRLQEQEFTGVTKSKEK